MIYTGPAIVCVGENMVIGEDGKLRMAPWSVPRNVVDEIAPSGGDGKLLETTARAMKLLIDKKVQWRNNTPVDHQVRILPTRRFKRWITSNPNAVEFRDRWTSALDLPAAVPVVSGIHNGATSGPRRRSLTTPTRTARCTSPRPDTPGCSCRRSPSKDRW
jgi:hypothetical protein